MSESLVDLLLVRLGRDEEKRKVLKLLVTSLDMSVTDAEEAVNNSPSVIREAVPMGEARVIQKDLYPYIDLLPRFEGDEEPAESPGPEESMDSGEEEQDPPEDNYEEEDQEEFSEDETVDDFQEDDQPDTEEEHDDPILITSASDEVMSTNRCHICGRTPTSGERLAPCRTCGDLTCRECFDRVAHVCSKCAASGKSVEHANEGVQTVEDQGLVFDPEEPEDAPSEKSASSIVRYIAAGVLFIVAVGAVFYFMDPMNIFSGTDTVVPVAAPSDSAATNGDPDSLTSASSLDTLVSGNPDTLSSKPDSLAPVDPEDEPADPLKVGSIVLADEYSAIDDPPPVVFRNRVPSTVDAEVLTDESVMLTEPLSIVAAWIPVEIDDAVLLQYHDSTAVLVLAMNHPEATENRLELLRRVSAMLTSTEIDQLVLLYRENRYQDTAVMSIVASNFPLVQGVISPVQFQDFLSYREDCWESVSGAVSEWLSGNQ